MDCRLWGRTELDTTEATQQQQQEYWSGYLLLSPGDLPNPGIEPGSPTLQADSLPFEPTGKLICVYTWLL